MSPKEIELRVSEIIARHETAAPLWKKLPSKYKKILMDLGCKLYKAGRQDKV